MNKYEYQLQRLKEEGKDTSHIEKTVNTSIKNIADGFKSFIIYGEPQSGKTEMMIVLTAKLLGLPADYKIVIVLLNDNIELLDQNLGRFISSKIAPTPRKFTQIMDPIHNLDDRKWIIFAKKNAKDLDKLIQKIGKYDNKIIIDDEADYATPNSKVNKKEKSKINNLTEQLIGQDGIYIGVTATPARLDLNRTHQNENEKWIYFAPYEGYKGRDDFFPYNYADIKPKFLKIMPDKDDSKKYLQEALFSFISNVAFLNYDRGINKEVNYSLLVHTSGQKDMHNRDEKNIENVFNAICKDSHSMKQKYLSKIKGIIMQRYSDYDVDKIYEYVTREIERNTVIVMNSDNTKESDYKYATNPESPFTVVIGGNIVSRGVTFDNLLSMFFTRDVKNKMQQDTYIQRARMFGNRRNYIDHFELHIPDSLYNDWNECFFYNKISLELMKDNSVPVWIDSQRTSAVAAGSINKAEVISSSSREAGFKMFDYNSVKDNINDILEDDVAKNLDRFNNLNKILGSEVIPDYIRTLIKADLLKEDRLLAIHKDPKNIKDWNVSYTDTQKITRTKGFVFAKDLEHYGDARHHIFVIWNEDTGMARVYYKMVGGNLRYHTTRR